MISDKIEEAKETLKDISFSINHKSMICEELGLIRLAESLEHFAYTIKECVDTISGEQDRLLDERLQESKKSVGETLSLVMGSIILEQDKNQELLDNIIEG